MLVYVALQSSTLMKHQMQHGPLHAVLYSVLMQGKKHPLATIPSEEFGKFCLHPANSEMSVYNDGQDNRQKVSCTPV